MIEQGLRTMLIANETIGELISTRLYGVKLPQKPIMPAIVLTRISGNRNYETEGATGLTDGRYQLDCWDTTLKGARDLAEALRQALSGYNGSAGDEKIQGAFLENDRDLFDAELNYHRVSHDYRIWFEESADGVVDYARSHTISLTTDASGDAVGYSPYLTGRIINIIYVKDPATPFDDTADLTASLEATGQTILTEENITASKIIAPRQPVHDTKGSQILHDIEGSIVRDRFAASNDRVKIVVSNGGNTKSGQITIIIE